MGLKNSRPRLLKDDDTGLRAEGFGSASLLAFQAQILQSRGFMAQQTMALPNERTLSHEIIARIWEDMHGTQFAVSLSQIVFLSQA
ncbi:hypothetical protein K3495_g5597 [Podosphaera aphanis]|nr:hypothetical protein K3495_g5597 [Podosphaera aphanis]